MLRCQRSNKMGNSSFGNVSVFRKNDSTAAASRQGSVFRDSPACDDGRNGLCLDPNPAVFTIAATVDNTLDTSQTVNEPETNSNTINNLGQNNAAYAGSSTGSLNILKSESDDISESNVEMYDETNCIPAHRQSMSNNFLQLLVKYSSEQKLLEESIKLGRRSTMPRSMKAIKTTNILPWRRSYSNIYASNGSDGQMSDESQSSEKKLEKNRARRYSIGEYWI